MRSSTCDILRTDYNAKFADTNDYDAKWADTNDYDAKFADTMTMMLSVG